MVHPPLLEEVVYTPEKQIERMLEMNARCWHDQSITSATIRELGDPPSEFQCDASQLTFPVLLRDAGQVLRTLRDNWWACLALLGSDRAKQWARIQLNPREIGFRSGAIERPRGIYWAVCSFRREWMNTYIPWVCDEHQRQRLVGIGAELPLIALAFRQDQQCERPECAPLTILATDLEVPLDALPRDAREQDILQYFYDDPEEVRWAAGLLPAAAVKGGSPAWRGEQHRQVLRAVPCIHRSCKSTLHFSFQGSITQMGSCASIRIASNVHKGPESPIQEWLSHQILHEGKQ